MNSFARIKLKELSDREQRWANAILHQVSRAFINTVVGGRDCVVMERLNGNKYRCNHRKYTEPEHTW